MLLLAKIKFARGDLGGSYESLLAAEAMNPQLPDVYTQIGNAYRAFVSMGQCASRLRKGDRNRSQTTRSLSRDFRLFIGEKD